MNDLAKKIGETADLSVMSGSAMAFLDQVPGVHRLKAIPAMGTAFRLATTANDPACLAMLGDDRARAPAEDEWERRGSAGDVPEFAGMIAAVRGTGLAYGRNEHTEGISAVGFALGHAKGYIHAISVSVPAARFIENAARSAAASVSRLMH